MCRSIDLLLLLLCSEELLSQKKPPVSSVWTVSVYVPVKARLAAATDCMRNWKIPCNVTLRLSDSCFVSDYHHIIVRSSFIFSSISEKLNGLEQLKYFLF